MKSQKIKIAPSLLSADFANLQGDIEKCNLEKVELLHIDIMDGHFVPNITMGPQIVKAIRPHANMPLDCHLMIENPEKYILDFAEAGADLISVHVEGAVHLHRTLNLIKSVNKKAGVVLNPVTPLEYAFEASEYVDFILLMSVNPGFGGQEFITSFLKRCERLRNFLDINNLQHVEIEVDGGIKSSNLVEVILAGANIIVSGSGLFSGSFSKNVENFRQIIKNIQVTVI